MIFTISGGTLLLWPQGAHNKNKKEKAMARRKLEETIKECEYDDAFINGHKAEESMEDIYHMLRKKDGARYQLTLKA
ncbi:MAG: hypothetical protein GY792_32570 [Gammaproteobacteria bacterium]|nr:hypothetical protein [Gammaproteobacteria bacterium]